MNTQIDWPKTIDTRFGIDVAGALDSLPFYVLMIDAKHRILFANRIMCQALKMELKDIIGAHCPTLVHGVDHFPGCPLKEAAAKNQAAEREVFDTRHNRWMKPSIYPTGQFTAEGEAIFLHLAYDITENKGAEIEILRLNRLYSVISHVNQTVIRAVSPEQLLNDVCRALVVEGEFKLAWVGKLEPASQKVIPVAAYGPEKYIEEIVVYADDRPEGQGPAGRSIRENKPIVQNDFTNDPDQLPWHKRAKQYGFRSSAGFPIIFGGNAWGTLAVYSDVAGYFGKEETAVLEETAGDVSFALSNLDRDLKHQLAKEALRKSEETLGLMFESATDGIVMADLNGVIQRVNKADLLMHGYAAKEDMVGRPAFDLVAEKDRNRIALSLQRIIEDGYIKNEEFVFRKKDGSEFPVEISAATLKNASDRPFGIMGIIKDITERKAAIQALKASEEKFRGLFNSMAEGFGLHEIIVDGDGKPIDYRFIEINPAFEKLTGLARSQVIGRTVRDANPGIEHFWIETYGKVALTGEAVRFDNFAAPLGKWYECYAYSPEKNMFAVMFTDITERKKALEILGRYELIANDSRDIILFLDRNDGKVLEANVAAVKAYGFNREELLSMTIYDLRAPETRGLVAEQITKADKEGILFETLHMRKNGSLFPVEVSSRGADIEGRRALVSIIRDITERKQAEVENQELRSKAEMSSRLAAVGEMAAGIAHEINNPLTGVIGFAELLLDKPDLPGDILEEIKIIHSGSQRVKDVVKRMLTFARQTKPVRTLTSITELIDNTLDLRSYVLRTANIEVVKDYEPNLPWITVDPGQMQEVFLNLIVNAEYAMKKANGRGKLTVKAVRLDKSIRISIIDDGPGISKEHLAKLFQPFFTTKAIGEGTGLGLSLSHGIISEHGGTIGAVSEEGKGATFTIELPINEPFKEQSIAALPVTRSTSSTKKARVLVVDDEPDIRSFVRKMLTSNGHVVEESANPANALESLSKGKFDAVLLDVRMPGMSGIELFDIISTRWPEMAHRVIFITGDTNDADIRQYVTTNNLPYIAKPFDQATLKIRVNAILSQKQASDDRTK